MAPGATAKLTIWRKGEEQSLSLTLGELPRERETRAATPDAPAADAPKLGMMLAPAAQVAGRGSEGVVVMEVKPESIASRHGLKTGDIILDAGGKKVTTPVDVREAIRNAHKEGKRTVLMRLKSDDTTRFVAVSIARA